MFKLLLSLGLNICYNNSQNASKHIENTQFHLTMNTKWNENSTGIHRSEHNKNANEKKNKRVKNMQKNSHQLTIKSKTKCCEICKICE